ncbi:MAG: hypothetical protein ACI837_001413 [Crocinitomicaceae bacterium]|jgi:hypothetical protein
MKRIAERRIHGKIKLLCFFALFLFITPSFIAQTSDVETRRLAGVEADRADYESKTVGTVTLTDNKAEIAGDQLDLNTVWVVTPAVSNMPFGVVTVENGKTHIDLSDAPSGDYYFLGKKGGEIIGYRTTKL